MSNQVSLQANKLWRLISAPTTGATYKQALSITWTILQETGKLLWLVFCLVLVGFDWFWNNSIRQGRRTRNWLDRFDRTDGIETEALWQEIVSSTQSSFNSWVSKARKQLGLYSQPDLSTADGAIVPAASAEIAPISAVPQMKRYEAAGEDEPVVLSGGFMTSNQDNPAKNPSVKSETAKSETDRSEAIETNAEPETVAVKSVSPKEKERVGEDEEVEHSPLKEETPSNS